MEVNFYLRKKIYILEGKKLGEKVYLFMINKNKYKIIV